MLNIMMELNIFCIMSQIIENESAVFAQSIYECLWYELPGISTDVLILMTSAKPLTLSIIGLIPLNMESYAEASGSSRENLLTNHFIADP